MRFILITALACACAYSQVKSPAIQFQATADAASTRTALGLTIGAGAPASSACNEASEAGHRYIDSTFWFSYTCPDGTGWQMQSQVLRMNGVPSSTAASSCNTTDEHGKFYVDRDTGGLMYYCGVNGAGTTEWIQVGSGGSFTVATQAEAEAGTDNTNGMTALRVAQAIQANVEGGDGIDCPDTTAGVECAVTSSVGRISSGFLDALPGSCTLVGSIYVATDAPASQKVYVCNGSTYERGGDGSRTLHSFTTSTALGTVANTDITTFSISANTLKPGDCVVCRWLLTKTGSNGALRSQFRFGGQTLTSSGQIDSGNATHVIQTGVVRVTVLASASQATEVTAMAHTAQPFAISNIVYLLTADTTSSITVEFEAWHTSALDTSAAQFFRCALERGIQ